MPQGRGLTDDERDLVAAVRQGDLAVCEQIVRLYGLEVLRTAFLLTGDGRQAARLTRDAFLSLFRRLPNAERDSDLRTTVLLRAGEEFLLPAEPEADDLPASISVLDVGHAERYRVDDARSRTRDGLALIDPPARLALVLRELSGVSIELIAPLLDERTDQTTVTLESSRRRMRNHLDLRPGESLRMMLASATFDVPTANLWGDLEDDVAALLRQRGQRARVLSAGVVAVLLVGMLVTLAILLRQPASEETVAAEPRFETNAYNDPPPFPSIAPPQAANSGPGPVVYLPTATPVYLANVPDRLVMALHGNGVSDGLVHLTEFRPRASVPLQPLVGWPRDNRERWTPVISADGASLFIAHFETVGNSARVLVSDVDSQSDGVNWQTELASVAAVPYGEKLEVFVSLAADDEHVFATLHFWRSNDLIHLVVLDRSTGEQVNAWDVNIAGRIANDVRVFRPPAGERVYVYAITQAQPALTGQMHISFYGYEVETGEQVHGKTLVEAENRRVFYIYRNQVTVDGLSLWGTTYRNNTGALAVQFFDLHTATVQPPVTVPFSVDGNREPVQEAVSHDGRWLYIFSPLSAEIAIVDLEQRRLLGVLPLDIQIDGALGAVNLPDATMQISPDGERIYAIGAVGASRSSGIWVIDTISWQLIDYWLPESRPSKIVLSGDGQTLYIHEHTTSTGAPAHGQIVAVDTASGEAVASQNLAFLPDATEIDLMSLAGLYRKQFGHSPSTGDVVPVDNRAYTSLPRVEASLSMPEVQAGADIGITVRFTDPLTGNLLTERQREIRYEPPAGVRAILRDQSGAHSDVIIELGRRGHAEFTGTASVDAPGNWTLILVNDWSAAGQLITTPATLKVLSATPGFGIGQL